MVGASSVVFEICFLDAFGDNFVERLVAHALLGVEEAPGVVGGEVHGDAPCAAVVGRADRRAVAEPGAGFDGDTGRGGGLLAAPVADAGLPAGAYGRVDPVSDRLGRLFARAGAVALHGALGD